GAARARLRRLAPTAAADVRNGGVGRLGNRASPRAGGAGDRTRAGGAARDPRHSRRDHISGRCARRPAAPRRRSLCPVPRPRGCAAIRADQARARRPGGAGRALVRARRLWHGEPPVETRLLRRTGFRPDAPPGGRCAAPAPGRGDRAAAMLGKRTRFRQIFLTHLRQVKGRLAIAAVGTLGATATELLKPWPLKVILDHVILDKPLSRALRWLPHAVADDKVRLLVAASGGMLLIALC